MHELSCQEEITTAEEMGDIDFSSNEKEPFSAKSALRASLRYTSEDDQWQTSRSSLRDRNQFMFNNELFSDVRFLVGRVDKKYIPGHKYIMAISSPVFSSIFYAFGALQAEQFSREQIEISECEPAAFLELLRYLYYDEVQLTTNTAPEVLFLARKYIIPDLAERCTEFLIENLSVDNTLTVLDQCCMLGVGKGLERQCWDIIDRHAEMIAEDNTFTEIDHGTLTAFLSRDTLVAKETTLFSASARWAGKECQRMQLPLTADSRRQILGDAFYSIRFPLMSMKEFTEQVARSGYLNYKEVANMYIGFNSCFKNCHVQFPTKPRAGSENQIPLFRCKRYSGCPTAKTSESEQERGDDENRSFTCALKLEVDKPVEIAGVGLFSAAMAARDESEPYEVVVELSDSSGEVISKFEGSITNTDEDSVLEVLLSPTALLGSGEMYELSVTSPVSILGDSLLKEVICEGVKFNFSVTADEDSETHQENGQIAEIMFYLPVPIANYESGFRLSDVKPESIRSK